MDFVRGIPFETVGVAVFALTGALMAARKGMDPFGFALLATVTGVGGGTLRDLLIGADPVFWVGDPADVLVCLVVAAMVFALGPNRVAAVEGGRRGRTPSASRFSPSAAPPRPWRRAFRPCLPWRSAPSRPPSGASSATSWPERPRWCCGRRST